MSRSPLVMSRAESAFARDIKLYDSTIGPRFSNLTHRGILTHGPYAWSKHPAYLSKNLFWWLSSLPFLATNADIKTGDFVIIPEYCRRRDD